MNSHQLLANQSKQQPFGELCTFRSLTLLLFVAFSSTTSHASEPFQFSDNERIVFVGNDFFEHESEQCYIETALTARFPEKNLTFRNLGYSGDTVHADARSLCAGWQNFGPPEQGFNRLKDLVTHLQPTVVFVAYGMNESFAGEAGLADFQSGLDQMLDMLSSNNARLILVSPIAHQKMPPPLPDPAEHNRNLELYVSAIQSTAARRSCEFVDLFHNFSPPTSDGIHVTADGYQQTARVMLKALGCEPPAQAMRIDASGKIDDASAMELKDVAASSGSLSFSARDAMLPLSPPKYQVVGLGAGNYELFADGAIIARGSAPQWAQGVVLSDAPDRLQEERLRKLIVKKNFDFFNDWRAQNDTYILGYRKHEQGRNAPEMAEFEKLTEEADTAIAKLRVPSPVHFELRAQK